MRMMTMTRMTKMKTKSAILLVIATLWFSNLVLSQPQAAPQSGDGIGDVGEEQTITVDVDLVNVFFTVTDRSDELFTGLVADDLRVYEDDVRQTITNFDSETDLPLTIALLVDTSGSIRDRLRFEQEAAIEFFYSTIERRRDRGMLVAFDSGVDLIQDFTDSAETLSDGVRKIRAGGGTSLYDAIYLSISEKIVAEPEGRRVMIVISDGDDNASRFSLIETLEMAQRNNVAIYTISTNSAANFQTREQRRGDDTLKTFAEETGGQAFFPLRIEQLALTFQNISEALRSQYTLTYISTNLARDGSYREIRLEPADNDYEVKARWGYYAPRD
jgi:Ca-activated chloride channel family protein